MKLKKLIEIRLIKNILSLESSLSPKKRAFYKKDKKYLIGFKKGSLFFDLEKSLVIYFKVLFLIKRSKNFYFNTVFVNCPKILNIFLGSKKFYFVDLQKWKKERFIKKAKFHFSLIFNPKIAWNSDENIPMCAFLEGSCSNVFLDYAIFFNLSSKGVIGLYAYLLNEIVFKNRILSK